MRRCAPTSIRSCGHASGACAYEHDRGRVARRVRGLRAVIADVGQESFEKELPRRQPFDDAHGRATARTRPRGPGLCGDGWLDRRWRGDHRQGRATGREVVSAASGCEQARVADTDEALWQDVQEKASEEFIDVERQRTDPTPVPGPDQCDLRSVG